MAKTAKRPVELNEQAQYDNPPNHLINFLGHDNGWVRHHARECLVLIGKPAVPDLIEALENEDEDMRWEAAKALGQIKDPTAAPALAKALNDKNFGVRWLAAEGLIMMRANAIPPLLKELIQHPEALWLRQGAYHVLHDLARKRGFARLVAPVITALEGVEPALMVPTAAKNLLDTLTVNRSRARQRLEN